VLLEVNGDVFRTNQYALKTVRPFVFESVRAPCSQSPGMTNTAEVCDVLI